MRAAQSDAYPKDEFKLVSTSLENLMDELVAAVPSFSGLQKTGSKRRHDEMAPDPAMPLEDGSLAELQQVPQVVAGVIEGGAVGSHAQHPEDAKACS